MRRGDNLEILAAKHFRWLFEEMGFQVTEVRRQNSGAQFGFDIRIEFYDDDGAFKSFCIECKDYSGDVNWNALLRKIFELDASAHTPDAFIAISPKSQITNINDNTLQQTKKKFGFAIDLWDTTNNIRELFALDSSIYYELYNEDYSSDVDSQNVITSFKRVINDLLLQKKSLDMLNKIQILDSDRDPNEAEDLKTTLDDKLNAVLSEDDPLRIQYHKYRCDYKVYLENLEDVNNDLRLEIIEWQENLKIKANRLTNKFRIFNDYNPQKFYYEFFDEAKKDLDLFFKNGNYTGDIEKLLHGIVFELAAECPLDWRR